MALLCERLQNGRNQKAEGEQADQGERGQGDL